jgi:protoporphyrinogen oxidase
VTAPALRHVVIGAGPAGLTAAYELTKAGEDVLVLEGSDVVGGISQTVERDGWRFDIGGHRFFTKVPEVEALWHEILPDEEFLMRPRMSRIFYDGKLYDYPLKAANALRNLGPLEAVKCVLSYLWVRIHKPDESNYEGWVASRFGWRLYRTFFKTYTEKVWGMPASEMPADWAAQRIKNLSLGTAVLRALFPALNKSKDVASLIEEFQYPKLGPGMMWERCRDKVEAGGGEVAMQTKVVAVHHEDGRAVAVTTRAQDGSTSREDCDSVVSSMPLSSLIRAMDPPPPAEVLAAANGLRYRDFITVALVVPEEFSFPDNWIYIHEKGARVGRIQNFGSWSPYLVKDGRTCLGLEYFVNEGDELWTTSDEELVALATREVRMLGLVTGDVVEAGYVVRMPKAYPVYDVDYAGFVQTIRDWIADNAPNVHPVGRNGMHKYNNQDHSMLTAQLTVKNILGATPPHDIWQVNVEEDYHEEQTGKANDPAVYPISGTGREAPMHPRRQETAA